MEDENELIALRRKKLEMLRAKGIEPFGTGFDVSGSIAEVREQFKEGETLRVAGRITAHRDMGKSHFLDLRDATGRIQKNGTGFRTLKRVTASVISIFSPTNVRVRCSKNASPSFVKPGVSLRN